MTQSSGDEYFGAVKIKDGLFMGDMYAAQDAELLITNKITHIVNCAGRELTNHWESIGTTYLTLTWQETNYQTLFEGRIDFLGTVYKFIENALNKGESVLIHSLRGQNRCTCAVAAYCMKKYRWTLNKTLEFLHSRKPNISIRPNFISQLAGLENKLALIGQGAKSEDWKKISDNPKNLESEELLITNTFLNSQPLSPEELETLATKEYKPNRLMWADQHISETNTKPSLITVIPFKGTPKHRQSKSLIPKVDLNAKEEQGKSYVKSILKGSDKIFIVEDLNKDKGSKIMTGTQKVSIQTPTGRKVITKLRPGSAITPAGGSLLAKSSSTSALERVSQDIQIPNIQGNIVHITVNNFIASHERPSSAKVRSNNQSESKSHKVKKPKLFMSSSTKDLGVSENELTNFYSSLTSDMNNRNMKVLFQNEEKPTLLSQSVKFNNFTKDPSNEPFNMLAVYGSGTAKYNSNDETQQGPKIMSQSLKGFKIEDPKVISSSRNANTYASSTNINKSLGQGRSVPIRVINDIDISSNPTSFLPKTKKLISRPLTAPNKMKKKELVTSPYFNADNFFLSAKNSKSPSGKIGGIVISNPGTKTVIKKISSKKTPLAGNSYNGTGSFFPGFEVGNKMSHQY